MEPHQGRVVSSLIRVVRHLKITIFFLAILAGRLFDWPGRQPGDGEKFRLVIAIVESVGVVLGALLLGDRLAEYLMARPRAFFFVVGVVIAAVEAWRSNTSQLDCSVLGQPIGPVTQEGSLGRPMEQTVQEELSGKGHNVDDWAERALRWWKWPNTFRLDRSKQPFGSVRPSKSWRGYLRPMKQKMDYTCSIMACTMAVEGMHRKVYETLHGSNTFPDAWMAAEGWTDHLLDVCKRQDIEGNDDDGAILGDEHVACNKKKKIWTENEGSIVGYVLAKIKELRGVRTAGGEGQQLVMPLDKWEKHSGDKLTTPEQVAKLLDQGPCVGRLWACPWYRRFNAAKNDGKVYYGCGRDKAARDESRRLYGNGSHAVVCFAYRLCENGEMHVCVLDNHTDDGPERWVDVEELDALYALKVDCLCGSAEHHHDAAGASAAGTTVT